MKRSSFEKTRSAFRRALALGVGSSLFALGSDGAQNLTPTPSEPSSAAASSSAPVERVVVTGSNIARNADEVPPNPVVVIDRAGLENSGRTTVAEVLRRLPMNTGASFNEAFTNGFAPGSAGLSLRGLGQSNTLTLFNGRRVAPYALPQNATDSFANLNAIPQGAVERIEILKDSASAIYGADAIAGVVNIILREDYQGFEISSRYGDTTHSNSAEITEQLVTGVKTEKGSLLLTADYFKRNGQQLSDRVESRQANQTGTGNVSTTDPRYLFYTYPGGSGVGGPGTLPKGTAYGFDYRSGFSFPGQFNLGDGNGAISPALGSAGAAGDFTPGYIPYNYNTSVTDLPETERLGFFAKGKYDLFPWLTGYTEGMYSNTKTKGSAAPTPFSSASASSALLIGADNPFNPFGVPIGFGAGNGSSFSYRGLDFGPRTNRVEEDDYRVLGGAKVKLPMDLQFDTAFVYSQSRVTNVGQNYLSAPALRAALVSTDPATALNVFSGVPGANSQALLDSIKATTVNNARASLLLYDGKLTGPIPYAKLPAGSVMIAVGGEYRDEKLVNQSDGLSNSLQIVSQGGVSTVGRRDVRAGFYELSIPVFSPSWNFPGMYALDLIVAQRYEDYSDFGNYSTPKFTVRYQPIRDFVIRGSYSEGVRAPSLSELAGSNVNFQTFKDPLGGGGGPDYQVNQGGNANLKPEKSYAYYGGVVYSPSYVKGLSISVDYSEIIRHDDIATPSVLSVVQSNPAAVNRDANGMITSVDNLFQNIGQVHVKAIDFDVNYNFDTGRFGVFSLDATGTYLASYKGSDETPPPGSEPAGYNNKIINYADSSLFGSALPDFKGQASVFWQLDFGTHQIPGVAGYSKDAKDGKGVVREGKNALAKVDPGMQTAGIPQSVRLGLTVNYVDSYAETVYQDDATGVKKYNYGPTDGLGLRTVQAFTTVDLLASYTISYATFTLGVNNLLDEKPPFVYGADTGVTGSYDFSSADDRGRFIYGELRLKF